MGTLSRRLRLRPIGVGGLVVILVCGASWAYAQSPTVTFQGGPLAPVLCPAAPDHDSLALAEGTWVNVVNQTGATAHLEVDGRPGQAIAMGTGLSVRLPVGLHEVRLIPACPKRGKLVSVAIEIVAARPAPNSPSATGSPSPRPPRSAGPDPHPPGLVVGGRDGVGRAGTAAAEVGSAGSDRPGPADTTTDLRGAGFDVMPYAVSEPDDPRGARLLAVVGAICVFGVTAAIIRAILAQRTTRTLSQ